MSGLEFRASTPHDEAAIRVLCQQTLQVSPSSPMFDSALMHWKYWMQWPGWSGARSFLALRDGAVLAHIAALPIRIGIEGEQLTLLHPLDWAALPGNPGVGTWLLERLSQLAAGVLVVGGSALTQRILGPLGFRVLPSVTRFAAYRAPASNGLRSVLTRAHTVHPSNTLRTATLPFGAALVPARSDALLAHWQQCPVIGVEARQVLDRARSIGTLLTARAPGQLRILDVTTAESGDLTTLFVAARGLLTETDALEVAALASTQLERDALIAAGYSPCGALPMFFRSRHPALKDASELRFQLLDGDAGFLHHGQPERWL
ncbi:MAG TPA: hypothetical protein VHM70_16180 [Polyangiaceae bacterium]|nr:hypothetical protein [Polyangiaceae bacterium]